MTPEELKNHLKEQNAKKCRNYRKTEKGRAAFNKAINKYRQTEKGKVAFRQIVKRYQRKLKKEVVESKGGKCEKCGFDLPHYASFCLVAKKNDTPKFGKLKPTLKRKEYNKYQLLCANCHRNILYDTSK